MIKFGIIGCGKIAKRHANLLSNEEIKGAKLFSVYDVSLEAAKSFSKEYLTSLCKGEYDIYNDWEDGDKFVFEFPEKINYFLESYCDKV